MLSINIFGKTVENGNKNPGIFIDNLRNPSVIDHLRKFISYQLLGFEQRFTTFYLMDLEKRCLHFYFHLLQFLPTFLTLNN